MDVQIQDLDVQIPVFIRMVPGSHWIMNAKDMEDAGSSSYVGRQIITEDQHVLAEMLRINGRGGWVDHRGYR